MATVVLTDEQVVDLVLQLPAARKRLVMEALKADCELLNEPEVIDKQGLFVVRGPLHLDISNIVDQEREARVTEMLAQIQL